MQESLYNKILFDSLKRNISERLNLRNVPHNNRQINGYVKKIVQIIEFSRTKKKFINDKFDGFHIHSNYLKSLKRNPLDSHFSLFERSNDSTYHANNSKTSNNGYSHWYRFDDLVLKSMRTADVLFTKKVQFSTKYQNENEKYTNIIKSLRGIGDNRDDLDTANQGKYLKIQKKRFLIGFKYFTMGYFDFYSKLLNNLAYVDESFVYINNRVEKSVEDKLDGLGREYTVIGLMPKDMRKIFFRGYEEIDMSAAVQNVLVNLYYKDNIKPFKRTSLSTLKEDFPKHYELITDKKRFREHYASLFKCDYKKAKEIITSITYSPKNRVIFKNANNDYISNALDKFGAKRLSQIKAETSIFKDETEKIRDRVLEKFYYQNEDYNPHIKIGNLRISNIKEIIDDDIRVHNLSLDGKGKGKKLKDRITYRLYELMEHQIRNVMIEYLQIQGINEVYQIHDGLIYYPLNKKINAQGMRAYIYKELDLNIQLDKSAL